MGSGPAIDAARVIADLRELGRRTSDEHGAQRVCWSPVWRQARRFLGELLGELGAAPQVDEAGNLWATLEGADPQAPALALGSHVDSVPGGGWLDGALGVMAAVGVLRAWSAAAGRPPRPLVLVDWADEEGARFGRSLFGSSAFAGTLDPGQLAGLRDAEGLPIAEVLAENDVDLARAGDCAARREGLGAYLELHIEQGPTMEAEGLRAAAVTGCAGVERLRLAFAGQTSHAGTTPMELRHDAGLAAAEAALEIERIPAAEGGVATTGELRLEPGIPTAIAGEATLSVDLRHPYAEPLARMLEAGRAAGRAAAERRGCELTETQLWRIEPIPFDAGLVFAARRACEEVAGAPASMASGALHDAAEVARVLPAVMVFAPSKGGISHAPEEDTDEADLAVAIEAYAELAARTLERD
ncbi:MAG: beta-ureidopropionase / N-carbamoyl-L-amino-acid hydrolase [Solirubrobacterales bacterium]|jgi:N-carbamoyl-L-amino-acid hydrolase|nr:beta-ureidopropionase / N-carbamoyl-L-amino-acid hydrolase [Solirubrobacterales bacterium]